MKTRKLIIFFTMGIILLGMLNCKNTPAQNEYSEEQIVNMLKNFYTGYITENSKIPENKEKLDSIKNEYCTTKLLNYIQKQFLERVIDYDPFLNAQMIDTRMLETLTIKKDSVKNNLYYVSYTYGGLNTIKLTVVKEKDCYKIDHIFLAGLQEETP